MDEDLITNRVVYKLEFVHKTDTDLKYVYIGSTENFKKRTNDHMYYCKRNKHSGEKWKCLFIDNDIDLFNINMYQLEEHECNRTGIRIHEQKYLELYRLDNTCTVLNERDAYVSPEDAKKKTAQRIKEYNQTHKKEIKEQSAKYYHLNRDKIILHQKIYDKQHKHEKKEYYQKNKEYIKQRTRAKYYNIKQQKQNIQQP